MKKFSLVTVNGKTFICRNAEKPLLNCHCNSLIFKNKKDVNLKISVFDYFNVRFSIVKKLDMRTKEAKHWIKKVGFFSVSVLPELSNL